jgi:hypothetical protein
VLVFVGHASLFGSWLVDDAGITLAYARNLATGYGLVAQPGVPPVEGFSNPLWTLLLAPCFVAFGDVEPALLTKTLALLLVAAAFSLLALDPQAERPWPAFAALLLAVNASFAIWTTSGLENPLLALLLIASARLAMHAVRDAQPRLDGLAGVVAAALALTRPDAILFAAAYPIALCAARWRVDAREAMRRLPRYGSAFLLVFGAYFVFRVVYFGDVVPNTYRAKVQPWMMSHSPERLLELGGAAAGWMAWPALGLALSLFPLADAARRPRQLVLGVYLAIAGAAYLALPPDWMGEFRFATPFFIFLAWLFAEALAGGWRSLRERAALRVSWLVPTAAVLLLAETTAANAARSTDFSLRPTVPFTAIATFAKAYDELAERAAVDRPSLLAPDLGGTLFHVKRLRVYDLAGLCDKTVARTLMVDTQRFHDYVFREIRPTFIHVHGSWSEWAALHEDARFTRDYAPLLEEWRGETTLEPSRADYVRRDAARASGGLAELRQAFLRLGLHRALP